MSSNSGLCRSAYNNKKQISFKMPSALLNRRLKGRVFTVSALVMTGKRYHEALWCVSPGEPLR